MKLNFFSLWALAGSASAYLATTTVGCLWILFLVIGLTYLQHYYDGQEGACGCGTSSGLDTWQVSIHPSLQYQYMNL
jgi:endoglucanase